MKSIEVVVVLCTCTMILFNLHFSDVIVGGIFVSRCGYSSVHRPDSLVGQEVTTGEKEECVYWLGQ